MKFDIESHITGKSFVHRAMMRDSIGSKVFRSRAGAGGRAAVAKATKRAGLGAEPVTADRVPDFEVVVLLERLPGNRFTAVLRWFLLDRSGVFPVIPETSGEQTILASTKPYLFTSEREAVIEGSRQSRVLVDQFFTWATEGVDSAVQPPTI